MQKHMWDEIKRIKKNTDPCWRFEDNQESMELGWMIMNLESKPYVDLFTTSPDVGSPKEVMKRIVDMAPYNALCAKAVGVLTGMKLKFPDVRFAFDLQDDKGS